MEYQYGLRDFIDPSRKQFLRYIYGNHTPPLYAYEPDAPELSNIKDEVDKAIDSQVTIVYRNGWESYLYNRDAYKHASAIPDSVETALTELIEDERVDRLIVLGNGSHYSNILNWGYCWRDAGGAGVSRIDNETYYDCITNLNDGCGPENDQNLADLLTKKPWRTFLSPYPDIYQIVQKRIPGMQVTFARPFGDYPAFTEAIVEMFKHTVAKYSISSEKTVKVILALHGYSNGYMLGAQCDAYFNRERSLAERAVSRLQSYLAGAWGSVKYEVVSAVNEFSEPFSEDTNADPPSRDKPMGSIMSTGEHIDIAINGVYVNELGHVIDNGNDRFDYVMVIPILWDAENVDTIKSFRELTLGNHALQSAGGSTQWFRQPQSEDGDAYNSSDFDSEYFTVKVMDASGWESTPALSSLLCRPVPVKKGSAQKPTTIILTGTVLSQGNGPVRSYVVQAAAESILEAIDNPSVGGHHDEACEMRALYAVVGLRAEPRNSAVELTWKTLGEVGSTGFNIYRSESAEGPFVKVNEKPIASNGSSSVELRYAYRDGPLKNRTTYYYRIEHEFSGTGASFGPVSATPRFVWFFWN